MRRSRRASFSMTGRKRWKRLARRCTRPRPARSSPFRPVAALVERDAVQSFWRQHYQDAFAARMEGNLGECLISGKTGAIAPTHEKIKGVYKPRRAGFRRGSDVLR